ncbi:MAG: efflux RND transporter periplasmic adaptor subunit [Myxococcota bacterium]|nr:efflux RND transporter periplasmic adaptor subunit [Myxococcota bacterium]
MSLQRVPPTLRRFLVPAVVTVLAAVALIVFRHPLAAWFTGKALGSSEGAAVTAHAGPFTVEASLSPDPPREKDQTLVLSLRDASGNAVDDATVDVVYDMAAMGTMAEMKGGATVTRVDRGKYRAKFDLPMASSWTLRATVRAGLGSATQRFAMTVGTPGLTLAGGTGDSASASSAASMSGEIDHYTCSMHPSVKQSGPGTCPICGMNLIPVTKEQQQQGVVMIDEARRQLSGVRTGPVLQAPMRQTFRAVGHVAYDESALADVNLKVHGWITKLLVNETGQHVTRGQTLFTMYSPELYNAEQDFLLATHGASAAAPSAEGGPSRTELFKGASRQRLHLLGLTNAQIDAIAAKGQPSEELAIPSPASGFVIEKNVVEGASVDAGMRLYRIAALNKVWVEAEVYESDLAHVRTGQRAKVTLDYLPGHAYEAKVAYVYPYLDPTSRTGRVRFEIANGQLELRPGMYASVELSADLGPRVQVPTSAVVYTGPRRLAFVDVGGGRFRPAEVQVGAESDGMYEVLGGLAPGDVVATSGVFLIAAEARISTAATYWDSTLEEPDAAAPATAPVAPAPGDYTCPMHPEVHSPTPGKCPQCRMDLRPRARQP